MVYTESLIIPLQLLRMCYRVIPAVDLLSTDDVYILLIMFGDVTEKMFVPHVRHQWQLVFGYATLKSTATGTLC